MKNNFPNKIPIFPLSGVIYFPKTNLPLNIFEKRYLQLVDDIMKNDKYMGMIQSKENSNQIYKVGCLGKVSDFKKTADGRILLNLTGIIRFEIINEIDNGKNYREFEVFYDKFKKDLTESEKNKIQSEKFSFFTMKIKKFFEKNGLLLNWKEFEILSQSQQINTLSMIAPISNEEKQKLLETVDVEEKTKILSEIIEFYLHETNYSQDTIQ